MNNPQKHVRWVVAGIMVSVFLASMESTVVATAMPTIASNLGGFGQYSWVFAAYLLTSTTMVPIFGKLSDLYGRRSIYAIAMLIFLVGSLLCGLATSMQQLIWFRAVQGIGAGGVLPLAFIMIGEMFSFEQRARMQGLFSGVWGVSSVVGPLLGGFIVDQLNWHWIFLINLPVGAVALAIVWSAWRDAERPARQVTVDVPGALLLTGSVVALMLGLQGQVWSTNVTLIVAAVVLFVALLWWERRVADPILPLPLFRDRLFSVSVAHGTLTGWAVFGSLSFVPLFVQGVIGTSATEAGVTLTPMLLSWVTFSIIGSRLLLRVDYKRLAVIGMVLLVAGTFLMMQSGPESVRAMVMVNLALIGAGMGLSVPSFLIAVQSSVARSSLGTATSMLQFSRSIGGTLGVGIMGALLSSTVLRTVQAAGGTVDTAAISGLLAGGEAGGASVAIDETLRLALAAGTNAVFVTAFVAALMALGVAVLAPGGKIGALSHGKSEPATGGQTAAPATAAQRIEAPVKVMEM